MGATMARRRIAEDTRRKAHRIEEDRTKGLRQDALKESGEKALKTEPARDLKRGSTRR